MVATTEFQDTDAPLGLVDLSPAARALSDLRLPVGSFLGAQLIVLVLAAVEAAVHGVGLLKELTIWDGQWYLTLAAHGYPASVPHGQSALGFLPLYPALMWLTSHVSGMSLTASGLLLNRAGGLVSTILVYRLSTIWWGPDTGRRATLLYSFFPGAMIFSLVYSDGLFMALVTACLLCLERRRWLAAGIVAALATATGADGTALVVCCMTAAILHLWRCRAWEGHWEQLRCLAAPILAPLGLVAFASYLWVHTGNPLASFETQNRYWGNHFDLLATFRTYDLFIRMNGSISLAIGLLGVPFVLGTRYLLLKLPNRPPGPALAWGFGVTFLSLASAGLSPNPRMLLFAFPSGVILGRWLRGTGYMVVLALSVVGLVVLSWLTLSGAVLP